MTNKAFTTEQEFNKEVVSFLRRKFNELKNKDFKVIGGYESIASDNYVIRDFTFLKKNGKWNLYIGADEIDVIIYKDTIPRKKLISDFVKTTGVGVRGNIIIPLIIFELKLAQKRPAGKLSNFSSHDAIASNMIIADIKRLFPRVIAIFGFDNFEGNINPEENISFKRMLYNFDYIFMNWEKEKDELCNKIKQWLKI